ENDDAGTWKWRAGGLLLQSLAREGGRQGEGEQPVEDEDDPWLRTRILASTVEDHELIDPLLAPDRLLYRLFHEEGVRVHEAQTVEERCRCSRERVERFLRGFGKDQLVDMREPDGSISVNCEFCSTTYRFEPGDLD